VAVGDSTDGRRGQRGEQRDEDQQDAMFDRDCRRRAERVLHQHEGGDEH
jgi:hypothetical protein